MSVIETDKIDAMGISKNKKGLMLMLADHLDWENEVEHLNILQEKINAYLSFIESNQYLQTYPGIKFESYTIDIRFKFKVTENCLKFLEVVNKQLKEHNIQVISNVEGD
ncbi:MAG: DUF6572 domain-containing protein [Aminipila sp.]